MAKRPSVLIIESRQNTRTLLEMTLCHDGMRVFSAVDLDSARLQLRVLQPDLIIVGSDHGMVENDDAMAQLRALSPAPLLALGRGAPASMKLGPAATLPYPISAGELCAKVAELLGSVPAPAGRAGRDQAGRDAEGACLI